MPDEIELSLADAAAALDTEPTQGTELDQAANELMKPEEPEEEPVVEEEIAAAPEEDVQDADVEEVEEDPEYPPIDPPSSWTAEEKEAFHSLPHDKQEVIARRERERTAEIRRRQNEFAEQQKALEEQRKALETERQTLLESFVKDTLTPPDEALLDTDPVEYLKQQRAYEVKLREQESAKAQLAETQKKQQEQAKLQYSTWLKDEVSKLTDPKSPFHIAEYNDPVKGQEFRQNLAKYAIQTGVPQQSLGMLSALETNIMYKAMKWDNAQKAARAAKAKNIPKVSKPGTAKNKSEMSKDARAEALKKLDKTGSIEDAVSLLMG